MHKAISLVGLLLLIAGVVPAMAEGEHRQRYGNCLVQTQRDDFTDKVISHQFICFGTGPGSRSLGSYGFVLSCGDDNGVVLLGGVQFHLKERIRVRYRWGKKEAQQAHWQWVNEVALWVGAPIVDRFLDGMATTERLIYEVGDERGVVAISDAERAGIQDFNQRCGQRG